MAEETIHLQVALDLLDIDHALEIAKQSVDGGADWIEAGTPLIKKNGIVVVTILKREFPDKVIVADMKTMDTGALEVNMAIDAGADIVSILGVADDKTIEEGAKVAHVKNKRIMVDLIGCKNVEERATEVEQLGADILLIHTGIDQQHKGETPFENLKKIIGKVKIPIAVAGGLNAETAPVAIKEGARIVIVGGAITKAANPQAATKEIINAIKSQ